jgi:hypothetical protein
MTISNIDEGKFTVKSVEHNYTLNDANSVDFSYKLLGNKLIPYYKV